MTSTLWPPALSPCSAMYASTPWRKDCPATAKGPVYGPTKPIFTGSCAEAPKEAADKMPTAAKPANWRTKGSVMGVTSERMGPLHRIGSCVFDQNHLPWKINGSADQAYRANP